MARLYSVGNIPGNTKKGLILCSDTWWAGGHFSHVYLDDVLVSSPK